MRQRIIEALTYPRMMLLANLEREQCPHNLQFDPLDQKCQLCEQGDECHWLTSNDEFSVLANKPLPQLLESLAFCIIYVDAACAHANHNTRYCACDSCQWVKSARRLVAQYRNIGEVTQREF
jgi:hypothetical protein